MELPQRKGEDRFLPAGRYHAMEETLRSNKKLQDVRSIVVSAFDRRTRMFPFVNFDWYTVPAGPRSIAGALYETGMHKTRFAFQLWNPNIRPSQVRIDGQPIDMLLVSSMQVHSAASFQLVQEAWSMGDRRPLIICGGPKACYEPFDYFGLGPDGQIGADVVVTGEEPILLELLIVLSDFGAGQGNMRTAFNQAKKAGALREIPGLVYSADDRYDGKNLVNTGIQRLLRDLDELPMPTAGFRTLERPHRKKNLVGVYPLHKTGGGQMVTSLLLTRGCKYTCHYCPIPAYNQRSYRRKSPQRVVEEFIDCRRNLNTRYVFGADDNFFNNHRYTREVLELMASTKLNGKPLGRQIRFGTEATVIDAYKCRDLFPIAGYGRGGLSAIWMGVEDLSGTLVDKGQTSLITKELFSEMLKHNITPMVMMMHHDDQPLHSPGKMTGLIEQVKFLHKAGAMGLQCTLANPALGSRWITDVFAKGLLYESVGGKKIEDVNFDGNHVIASIHSDPWRMQINYLRAYAAFYNPWNLLISMQPKNKSLRRKYVFYQIWGMLALVRTAWRVKGYLWRLWSGPIRRAKGWPMKFRKSGSPYTDLIETPTIIPPSKSRDREEASILIND
ncbi:MAG: radical SAM protein [Phycisphaerae bacterium]